MFKDQSQEALENIALTVIRYRYCQTNKEVTSEQIEATVNECAPLLNGVVFGDKLQVTVNLCKRLIKRS